jgi:hypothetical protein
MAKGPNTGKLQQVSFSHRTKEAQYKAEIRKAES